MLSYTSIFFVQHLLTQYRAKVQNLQQQLGYGGGMSHPSSMHEKQEELRRMQTENVSLMNIFISCNSRKEVHDRTKSETILRLENNSAVT